MLLHVRNRMNPCETRSSIPFRYFKRDSSAICNSNCQASLLCRMRTSRTHDEGNLCGDLAEHTDSYGMTAFETLAFVLELSGARGLPKNISTSCRVVQTTTHSTQTTTRSTAAVRTTAGTAIIISLGIGLSIWIE